MPATSQAAPTPVPLLLVEDNPADVELIALALRQCRQPYALHVAGDADEAFQALAPGAGVPRPRLILLDLKLPGRSGHEVLAKLKEDPRLRRIPVVILTTSDRPRDVEEAYDHHANSYIVKPTGADALLELVATLEHYWFELVTVASR